jgi:Fe-S cluster biogenesis protein NfuA
MSEETLKAKVLKSLEAIRPALQSDGGDIELVEVDEEGKTVAVRLQGACVGCMGAAATLEYGVTAQIQRQVPEVKEVKAVF